MEQPGDLKLLLKKYISELGELEKKIADIKHKITVTTEVINFMKEEGVLKQDELFPPSSLPVSERYKNMTMRKAIIDVFMSHHGKYLSSKKVYDELMRNGFQSGSSNIRRDVSIRLSRFAIKEHILEAIKEKHKNKYRIAGEK